MDEYITREAAIKALEKADYTLIANDADSCKADYLREIIESVPAADVVPVVHGCWIVYETMSWRHESPKRRKYYRCSNCRTASAVRHKACPNCRAIMDADTQEREGGK